MKFSITGIICDLSRGKRLKAARQDFTGRTFEREATNEERYFPRTLQLNYGQSTLLCKINVLVHY